MISMMTSKGTVQYRKFEGKSKSLYYWSGFIYMIVAVVLAIVDSYVLPIYLTILPFHSLLLYLSIKTRNILFVFYSFMLFLSHGIGSVLFFIDRENAQSTGFNAIGNFDFSYSSLWNAYSYLFVFLLVLLLFINIFKKKGHTNFFPTFIKQQYQSFKLKASLSLFPIICCIILFAGISIWMYNLHIGMIGLPQRQLPFHLTGILFYIRRFLFPLILTWIYVKTKNKNIATISLIIYSFIVGITATSKSASILILLPVTFINYMIGKKKMALLCTISMILAYLIVGTMRLLIYEFDADIDIMTVLSTPLDFSDSNIFLSLMKSITGRLYGMQCTVLVDQYTQLTFNDLISFYTHCTINEIIPDISYTLFGIILPEDKAFGVGLGYNGTMGLLSCHNYYYTILQAFLIAIIFCIQNDCVQSIISMRVNIILKYLSILILLFSFLSFFDGNDVFTVYGSTLMLVLIRYLVLNRRRQIIRNN